MEQVQTPETDRRRNLLLGCIAFIGVLLIALCGVGGVLGWVLWERRPVTAEKVKASKNEQMREQQPPAKMPDSPKREERNLGKINGKATTSYSAQTAALEMAARFASGNKEPPPPPLNGLPWKDRNPTRGEQLAVIQYWAGQPQGAATDVFEWYLTCVEGIKNAKDEVGTSISLQAIITSRTGRIRNFLFFFNSEGKVGMMQDLDRR